MKEEKGESTAAQLILCGKMFYQRAAVGRGIERPTAEKKRKKLKRNKKSISWKTI